jgi:hypothetical protein
MHPVDAAANEHERDFAMHARSMYRNTLVSSASFASAVLDDTGAAPSAVDDEEAAEQGYWHQGLDLGDVGQCLRNRHVTLRTADASAYWNWRD